MYRKSVCIGGSVALVLIAIVGAPQVASAFGNHADVSAKTSCDRACLDGFVDSYLDALAAGDPSHLPLTPTVKFTEDGQRLNLGDGLWNTATGKGTYKFYMEDTEAGQVGFFGTMREAGEPIIISLRLKIENHKIAEIETIVVRDKGQAENLETRGYPDPLFMEDIPVAYRVSRAELVKAANMYFSGMQLDDGKGDYPFTDDCDRVENGMEATNNHAANTASAVAARGTLSTTHDAGLI